MAIKSKADIDALKNISDDDKKSILDLFDSIETTNTEIATLRTKTKDADEVVKKNKDLEKLLKEKETLSTSLQEKLNALTLQATVQSTSETFDDLLPFAELRKSIEDLLGDDPAE